MTYISSSLIYKRRFDLENIQLETIWVEIKLKSFNLLLCCFCHSDIFLFLSLRVLLSFRRPSKKR